MTQIGKTLLCSCSPSFLSCQSYTWLLHYIQPGSRVLWLCVCCSLPWDLLPPFPAAVTLCQFVNRDHSEPEKSPRAPFLVWLGCWISWALALALVTFWGSKCDLNVFSLVFVLWISLNWGSLFSPFCECVTLMTEQKQKYKKQKQRHSGRYSVRELVGNAFCFSGATFHFAVQAPPSGEPAQGRTVTQLGTPSICRFSSQTVTSSWQNL